MKKMKYSIIIPVYNVEEYLDRCLKSILNQTYSNYEVIIVNDGSPDNSDNIIKSYEKEDKRFKGYKKVNGGLSDARNYGLKYATGDYLIFIDADDYIENNYLEKVNDVLEKNKDIDVLKFKIKLVDEGGNLIRMENGLNKEGVTSFEELVKLEFLEPAWSYVYKLSFWKENNFTYLKGMIHEDFGLTPEILMKANKIYYLNSYLYNYVQRNGSIMSSNNKEKLHKKAYDMLYQYDRLIKINYNKDTKVYKSFLANALISKTNTLDKEEQKKYKEELRKRKVIDNLIDNTLKRKIKKIIYKIFWR